MNNGRRTRRGRKTVVLWAVLLAGAATAHGEPPLHQRIDRLIDARSGDTPRQQADDYEFFRRLTLDLAGRIPTPHEIQTLLEQPSEARRAWAIQRRLDSSEFATRMAELLDLMLMERRGSDPQWRQFLQSAMADNMRRDELARHVVHPPADDPPHHGAAAFIVKRLERYGQQPDDRPGLVRDVGRLFLGMDVQCAQCHDHLFIDGYKQRHYQGLFAFLGQAEIRRDTSFPAVSQKLMTSKVEFASVFDQEPMATGPRLPGRDELTIPELAKDEQYVQPPDRKTRFPGVPKFQPLAALADELTAEDNRDFALNFANRMWWVMMGRGLVDPLDLRHEDNPASHPELLQLLADEARRSGFDIRWMIGQLARTEAYQRSSRLPDGLSLEQAAADRYRVALERPLSAEQLCRSIAVASGSARPTLPPLESRDEPLWPLDEELLEAFRGAFANPPKDPEIDYRPSVKAALFLMNSDTVLRRLQPRQGWFVGELAAIEDPRQLADAAYLQCLSRPPSDEERAEAAEFLAGQADRGEAAGHLVWALLSSTEFLVNH